MKIVLAGLGMGDPEGMTMEARRSLAEADAVIGSERLLAALPADCHAARFAEAIPERTAALIQAHPEWTSACVALSGDVGFYSGARKLLTLLAGHEVRLLCGISTPQYLAARLRRPWQEFRLVSAHDAPCDVLAEVLNHPEVLFLTGGGATPETIVADLIRAGLGDAMVTVGENLSGPAERIVAETAERLRGRDFASPNAVLVENRKTFRRAAAAGIADDLFVRGDAPMTKREARAAALALLAPKPDSILYDVGSGTGSVAVEMALAARRGRVFAVERGAAALELLAANRERFGTYNLVPVPGSAPEALAALPPPEAAFVGGSGGRIRDILAAILRKNAGARLVVSAASLETLAAATDAMRGLGVPDAEACQISVARTVKRGGYAMLGALNPVFLISGGGTRA